MKTMMILAAVFAAGILMTTGCSTSKSASTNRKRIQNDNAVADLFCHGV
jgi:archaellin